MFAKLNGYKTYIVAGAGIAYTLAQMWSGSLDQTTGIQVILGFLGLGAVRHGIAKS